jgi:hypothetical protein
MKKIAILFLILTTGCNLSDYSIKIPSFCGEILYVSEAEGLEMVAIPLCSGEGDKYEVFSCDIDILSTNDTMLCFSQKKSNYCQYDWGDPTVTPFDTIPYYYIVKIKSDGNQILGPYIKSEFDYYVNFYSIKFLE